MALVTQTDVDLIDGIKKQINDITMESVELNNFMEDVVQRIEMTPVNVDTDFAVITAIYVPLWKIELAKFKILVEALPNWSQV